MAIARTLVATSDGRLVTGLVRSETNDRLTLVDAEAQGTSCSSPTSRSASSVDVSIMPEGLATGLSPRAVRRPDRLPRDPPLGRPGDPRQRDDGPGSRCPRASRCESGRGGLTGATAMAIAADGRVFVCEQTGTLRVVKDGHAPARTVRDARGGSLLGARADRRDSRPRLRLATAFVYVTLRRAPIPTPTTGSADSRPAATSPHRAASSCFSRGTTSAKLGGTIPAGHQGGAIHFGEDGKLYVAIGDQTAGAPAQSWPPSRASSCGSTPTARSPRTTRSSTAARQVSRDLALGLRNPFTLRRPARHRPDLHQRRGPGQWEEVNEGFAGAQLRLARAEGPDHRPAVPRADPLTTRSPRSPARPSARPAPAAGSRRVSGKYFFMDFVKGWIKVLDPDHPEPVETFADGPERPVDLAFAPDGSLYVLRATPGSSTTSSSPTPDRCSGSAMPPGPVLGMGDVQATEQTRVNCRLSFRHSSGSLGRNPAYITA